MIDESVSDGREGDGGFEEARRHLPPVVEHLSDKFPDADHDHVAEVVAETFDELSSDASIPDHLPALTQHHAQEQLLAEHAEHTGSAAADQ